VSGTTARTTHAILEHHGMEMWPILVQATAGAAALAGVMSLGQYHWWQLDGRTAGRSALRDGRAYIAPAPSST
jgi:hypothetical protein